MKKASLGSDLLGEPVLHDTEGVQRIQFQWGMSATDSETYFKNQL